MKFTFVVEGRISLHCDVEADSLDEAIAKAQHAGRSRSAATARAARTTSGGTSGELDCDPAGSELVEVCVDGDIEDGMLEKAKENWG